MSPFRPVLALASLWAATRQPKRLTWHPSAGVVSGWSADGRRVLLASPREVLNIGVDLHPAAVDRGEDTQLDAAIADVMKRLGDWKPIQRKTAPPAATLGR